MARIPIRMPKMSMTMTEGEVSSWMASVGTDIAEGDVVCEVMTDKVDMEVESPASGTLIEIVHEAGVVAVGEPIGWLDGDDSGGLGDLLDDPAVESHTHTGAPPPEVPAPEAAKPAAAESEPATAPGSIVPAVPLARTLARQHGIDLESVGGSGPRGRVRVADIRAIIDSSDSTAAPTPDGDTSPATPPAAPVASSAGSSNRELKVRRLTAAKMTESAQVPQFTLWRDLELDEVNAARSASWTAHLLQAYASALRVVPALLNAWTDDGPIATGPPAIGLAIDTPNGLLAPTLAEPDQPSAPALDAQVRALVTIAQTGKVDPAYLAPANAMLSNLGGLGVDDFVALVTPPQASALSVGSIKGRPVAVAGGLGTALTVRVGLTVDHRVADGADGARLLSAFDAALRTGVPDAGTA